LTEPRPKIVDIQGLADVLVCSQSTMLKQWREYPHFFIGVGDTAKGARFDINDVINYLKKRDYAKLGQNNKQFQRSHKNFGISSKNQNWIQDKNRRKKMGVVSKRPIEICGEDSFNILSGIK